MSKKTSDHALAIIKAGISAILTFGGPIASLIGDYVPTATEKSIKHAIEILKVKIEELGDRIDPDAVNKDQFAELFKSCYLIIVRTHQKEKLNAAAALLANILLRDEDPEKMSYSEIDHYAKCLDGLSVGAIETIGNCVAYIKEHYGEVPKGDTFPLNFCDIQERMPDTDPALLMGLVGELDTFNLIHKLGDEGLHLKRTDYESYQLWLTSLGIHFVIHLLEIEIES